MTTRSIKSLQIGMHWFPERAGGQDANMREEGQVKDEALFRTSKAYRAGWNGGLGACRRGRTTPASPSQNGPTPDIMPGGGALP